eukprot:m.127228 g.127228  ORF g.127228 m.127228 type:complete len:68 (+) comp14541_c0_seq3:722-925(+)
MLLVLPTRIVAASGDKDIVAYDIEGLSQKHSPTSDDLGDLTNSTYNPVNCVNQKGDTIMSGAQQHLL